MSCVESSVFCRLIINTVKFVLNAYESSILKKCADKVGVCWRSSIACGILHRYIYKRPYFQYSLVYRFVCFLARIADIICGALHNIFAPMIRGSMLYTAVRKIKSLGAGNVTYLAGILLMSIPIGSIISMIITDSVTLANMVLCWIIFASGMFVVLCGMYMTAFLSCLFVKALKWLTDIMLG